MKDFLNNNSTILGSIASVIAIITGGVLLIVFIFKRIKKIKDNSSANYYSISSANINLMQRLHEEKLIDTSITTLSLEKIKTLMKDKEENSRLYKVLPGAHESLSEIININKENTRVIIQLILLGVLIATSIIYWLIKYL